MAVTTADRLSYLQRFLPHLARACQDDPRLSIVVSLDGPDAATQSFCAAWHVPLVYSDLKEGVGMSKNRVVEAFPNYDYYFFLEDDIEILDPAVFEQHIEIMRAGTIHHMALFGEDEGTQRTGEASVLGRRIVHFGYGSAEFNVFTKVGLERVGGWHPRFAAYRRWGHTEHSYRFPRNGLAPSPFNVAVELATACIRHRPPSVTKPDSTIALDDFGISTVERELMAEELVHVPVQTRARYHSDGVVPGSLGPLADLLTSGDRYPLLSGAQRRDAMADFLVWRSETATSRCERGLALLRAGLISPPNIALRHAIKMRLKRRRSRGPDD